MHTCNHLYYVIERFLMTIIYNIFMIQVDWVGEYHSGPGAAMIFTYPINLYALHTLLRALAARWVPARNVVTAPAAARCAAVARTTTRRRRAIVIGVRLEFAAYRATLFSLILLECNRFRRYTF